MSTANFYKASGVDNRVETTTLLLRTTYQMDQKRTAIDPRNGFDSETKTFHSLRPHIDLPSETLPLSAADYALSLRRRASPWPDSVALIDSATGQRLLYSEFARRVEALAGSLRSTSIGLSKRDVAFVLSPNVIQVPILYFALLSLGVVVSPANPMSTESEIASLVELCKPKIAFATSATARKLSSKNWPMIRTILIDSPEFESMTMITSTVTELEPPIVDQSDVAAIMYSSGTTGRQKGVMTTHRNLIAVVTAYHGNTAAAAERDSPPVILYTVPYFHIYGFFYAAKSVSVGETVVVMPGRFELRKMLRAAEEFRVTNMALVPPIVVAMAKGDVTADYDLSSLEIVGCGAAPLGRDVIAAFIAKFPNVALLQGYGLTESTGVAFRMMNPEESLRWGTAGRLVQYLEAKIVDPETGHALPPCKQGELWIRGPTIMKGYIGNAEATSTTLVGEGWLRTGDLCYIDEEGYLHVVDRLKELIKYKGYQVAPAELEQLLQSHPEILDAAVIPYPDEEAGQVPMAIVVRRPQSSLGASQVMDFVAKQVAPYKKIRQVAFVDSIPKSPAGKILRRELMKTYIPASLSRL